MTQSATPIRPKVHFVYMATKQRQGSTVMRAHQMVTIASRYLSARYDISLLVMPDPKPFGPLGKTRLRRWIRDLPGDGIYIMTKACVRVLDAELAQMLQSKARGVCFDHVDWDFRDNPALGADIHLCSSFAQRDAIVRHQAAGHVLSGKPMMLLHNYDVGLIDMPAPPQDHLRTVYCGAPVTTRIVPEVAGRITVLDGRDLDAMATAMGALRDFNFHYCIRLPQPPGSQLFKPFTKGFTAAACGANVLVNRCADDAVTFLGDDYPYMVDELDAEQIGAALDRATDGFGGPEWALARDRMQAMHAQVTPQAIAGQLDTVLREFKD